MKWEMLSLESHTRQLNVILEAQKQIPLSNPSPFPHIHTSQTLSLQNSANIPCRIRLGRVVVLHVPEKRKLKVTEAKPKATTTFLQWASLRSASVHIDSEAYENEACTSTITNSTASVIVLW